MRAQPCYIEGMTGLLFVQAHRHDCATTQDVQKLVMLGWALDNPETHLLPWLWIEPSHIGQRGLFVFRCSPCMAPFLKTLSGWFDVQNDAQGQIFFRPSAAQRPPFDWLIPIDLAQEREHALQVLRHEPTIASWWSMFVEKTPLWGRCALGWNHPTEPQTRALAETQQTMESMHATWVKKTQAYYGIVEQSSLSWSMPEPDDDWMRGLGLCIAALDNSSLSMDNSERVHLNIPWKWHAPVLVNILNFHGTLLCEEYGIAEIPHDFLTNTLASRNPPESLPLPPLSD